MSQPPSRTADRIIIRLPDGMRDRLAAKAKAGGVTVTALVVRALERDLNSSANETLTLIKQRLRDTYRDIGAAERQVDILQGRARELTESLIALGGLDVPLPGDDDYEGEDPGDEDEEEGRD